MKKSSALFLPVALLVALVASACLLPGLGGGFIFDDRPNIEKNGVLYLDRLDVEAMLYAAYSFHAGNGARALSMLSFALDHWRGGMDARTFKFTNIFIHVLATLGVVLFLRRLLMAVPPCRGTAVDARAGAVAVMALVVGALWAFHPLQVSTVLYVVQRMQSLVTLFMVMALWAYLGMRQAQIAGRPWRKYGLLTVLFWSLGFASKEDAVLLPLYTFAIELTVLRFAAVSPRLAAGWRYGYGLMVALGGLVYLLGVVPHFWKWDAYPGRDFSSYERLLTQGRVLVMYLGQMVFPLPGAMPFYYDNLPVSRGWLQPATTLLAWLFLGGVLVWSWCWRKKRPLFALGILLFFAGHFITSNVLNLELAFEHRNQLPLMGVLLALGDLYRMAWESKAPDWRWAAVPVALVAVFWGGLTVSRAYMWGDPVRFAEGTLRLAPDSERAWLALNAVYVDRSGFKAGNPWLDKAIATCEQGALATDSAVLQSNAVIYKTIRGDVSAQDWERLHARLPSMVMNVQNKGIALNLLSNVERGMALDEDGVVDTWESMQARTEFSPGVYLRMASYVHNRTERPERALLFLRRAVELTPPGDPEIRRLFAQLVDVGREDWLHELQVIERAKQKH
ncbi:hypothetical protein [Stenotrophomonas mori]|uniref:Tetratricopeptide repeat protein n=1 Tax=Stenotrophomonas mori TaxID=2871096 RepID=A0ABT0SCX7_9GAMM|nr:hypothetical protein [Stenotrophomonas mori]MCL7713175.1 hypothetical protein [Stenotrophomonas mori]